MTNPNTSIYLHIPFCKHRCAYCDFNTYAGQEDSIPAYVKSLINEIEFVGHRAGQMNIHTVFFGGGTPSLLSAPQFDSILKALRSAFTFTADAEISIEANPGTISPEKLNAIRKAGINRISFGVQSANTEELRMLERIHDFFTVIEAVSTARKAGFDNLNLDLIYGLPEQTLASWQTTLQRIVDLHPEHISAYALTLEHGTPFGRWSSKGLLPLPDPDLAAEMYEYAEEFLEANGYVHYEISNWAKNNKDEGGIMKDETSAKNSAFIIHNSSFVCQHNLQYWHSLPYLAFGAGAHGYANGYRYSNALRIKTYIERLSLPSASSLLPFPLSPATVNQHKQTLKDDMSEYMLNNLRLTNAGVAESDFRLRFGSGLLDVYPKELEELIGNGLLEKKTSESKIDSDVYRLTKRGRLLGNQVFIRFV
ncbi:MAG: radical SAM family heme chaperone HemW [Anaerolineales bacterium]|uniref:radical SAM family heme chaperone HemW n=1 Tax=Candidatus Villigracilis proximus TaxID=3140683 RepID=UPI0031358522|nr:radical SAM family heme chaperone HemW [Anaerolineales bacterium]